MNDFHTFLRFALPGISSITELTILLTFSIKSDLLYKVCEEQITDLPISAILLIFTFFSIGLGFIYNLIYRILPFMMVDYSGFANHLKRNDLIGLNFFDYLKNQSDIECIERKNAWGIINTLWHSRSGKSKVIKEATERSEKFAHLLHNAATSLIGFVIIFILYIYLFVHFKEYFDSFRIFIVTFIFGLPLAIGHLLFFARTLKDFRRFVEVILLSDLKEKSKKKK
jgi:hypothetical protein